MAQDELAFYECGVNTHILLWFIYFHILPNIYVTARTTFSFLSSFFMHGWLFRNCCRGIIVKRCVWLCESMCEYVGVWEMLKAASCLTYSDRRDRACSSIAAKPENSPKPKNINWTAMHSLQHTTEIFHTTLTKPPLHAFIFMINLVVLYLWMLWFHQISSDIFSMFVFLNKGITN